MTWFGKLPLFNKLSETKNQIERETRVCLYHSDVYFKPMYAGAESLQHVLNISCGGIGLDKSNFSPLPEVGEIIPGQLILKDENIDLSIKVIHLTHRILGCQFQSAPSHLQNTLYKYLQTELSACQLIQIDPKILKNKQPSSPYYFRGLNADELYFVIKNNKIELFNVIINGKFFSGGSNTSFKYGLVKKLIDEKAYGFKRTDPIDWSPQIDAAIVHESQKFIDNIEILEESHRQLLHQLFIKAQPN